MATEPPRRTDPPDEGPPTAAPRAPTGRSDMPSGTHVIAAIYAVTIAFGLALYIAVGLTHG